MKELVIYRCEICGNIICMLEDSGVVPECCGMAMTQPAANTKDASEEKHVPVIQEENGTVYVLVGSLPHPMNAQHHIAFIILQTDQGVYIRPLSDGDSPEAIFHIAEEEKVDFAYAWCNLHGLWISKGTK